MKLRYRVVTGVLSLLGGVALMAIAASRMFAEGMRADATGTAGSISPIDFVLGIVGLVAFFAGVLLVGYAAAAKGQEKRMRSTD